MLLGKLRIRGKLAVLVIIPLLSMVGLAVPVVLDRVSEARRATDTSEAVRLANRVGSLVQDLQQERFLSVGLLLGRVSRSELVQKSAAVDDQVADLHAELGDQLSADLRAALDGVRRLAELRPHVLTGSTSPSQVMEAFGPINMALIEALRLPFRADTDTSVGRQVVALDGLMRADERLGVAAALIVLVKATSDPRIAAAYVANMAALQVDSQRFRRMITAEQYKLALLNDAAVAARGSPTFQSDSARDPIAAVRHVPLDVMFPSARSMITFGQFVEKKIAADVIEQTRAERQRALAVAWLVGGTAALVLLTVVLLSMAVARTVARPLTRLTRSADRVARVAEAELTQVADDEFDSAPPVRLDPVDVRAQDEIGDLARAFERVQNTAARLVERQVAGRRNVAQMFGHVGRRTQNLVGRQIALIDRLERQETDPGRLEHLYRLDHISSRLRRSAGSLMVLSGGTGDDGHVAPVPLADVVRLALGEIEDYTRVDVRVPSGVSAAPAIVGDLVLALAELMENATVFSPPHTRVTVSGEVTGIGALLAVADGGIGMTEERLAEENARLARRERLDLAPTEVLGLFVVGRLARRHGWSVELTHTPGGGVTARLEIPQSLLVLRRPDRVGVTSAQAAVPTRDRRTPGAIEPARSGRELSAAPPARPVGTPAPAFDPALLTRATHSMASARSWDAFGAGTGATPAGTTTSPPTGRQGGEPTAAPDETITLLPTGQPVQQADEPTATSGGTTAWWFAGPDAPVAGHHPVALIPPHPAPLVPTATAPPVPPHPAPSAPAGPPVGSDAPAGAPTIRQRVPGASLLPAGPTAGPADAASADPEAARALVEQFQSGVRRAEQTHPGPPAGAGTNPPRLARRVPGASLAGAQPRIAPAVARPQDPNEVRDRIAEFEAGVARALRHVSTEHRPNQEGSSR
ncbi:HAMP domain-containing protein [Micromonospora sp. KC606]|uniref:nitrate- and nitrite sensing domain-containing protein n=1 Tax=Micromonospora sp. KC606 TaxID=2530379 RepID=UPI001050145B|nr:nitrate- and nitrite sensing domain-containing protein [Micromonospora sp. KC606]TDC76796.1 HAMP domain-containing protein [Micromonospora sp. KC606]